MTDNVVVLRLEMSEAQMLEKILAQWEEEESYHGCNDPTYPQDWTVPEQIEFDTKLFSNYVVKQDPDRAEDEDIYCYEGDYIGFMKHKVREAIANVNQATQQRN